jgi:peptidoglycan hydrolase CwlO-like protein
VPNDLFSNPAFWGAGGSVLGALLAVVGNTLLARIKAENDSEMEFIKTITEWNKELQKRIGTMDCQLEVVRATCMQLHEENGRLRRELDAMAQKVMALEVQLTNRPHNQRREDR